MPVAFVLFLDVVIECMSAGLPHMMGTYRRILTYSGTGTHCSICKYRTLPKIRMTFVVLDREPKDNPHVRNLVVYTGMLPPH